MNFNRGALIGAATRRATPVGNWWDVPGKPPTAAYKPLSAASLAASYVNLANPGTNDAAPGVAPTLDASGWVFDGSSQYLTSGIVPTNQNWTMLVRFTGAAVGTFWVCGVDDAGGANKFYLSPMFAGNTLYGNGGNVFGVGGGVTNGVIGVAGAQGYYNGAADGAGLGSYTGTQANQVFLGALNSGGSVASFYNGKISAMWIGPFALTAGEVASLTTTMAALT